MNNSFEPPPRGLHWTPILGLASLGLLFGALTITGVIHGWEGRVVLGLLAACGVGIAALARHSPVRHGALTGLLFGLLAVWSQAVFLTTYFENNPGYEDIEIPFGLSARAFTALFGPANALLAALVVAIVAWAFRRLFDRIGWPGPGLPRPQSRR